MDFDLLKILDIVERYLDAVEYSDGEYMAIYGILLRGIIKNAREELDKEWDEVHHNE